MIKPLPREITPKLSSMVNGDDGVHHVVYKRQPSGESDQMSDFGKFNFFRISTE